MLVDWLCVGHPPQKDIAAPHLIKFLWFGCKFHWQKARYSYPCHPHALFLQQKNVGS